MPQPALASSFPEDEDEPPSSNQSGIVQEPPLEMNLDDKDDKDVGPNPRNQPSFLRSESSTVAGIDSGVSYRKPGLISLLMRRTARSTQQQDPEPVPSPELSARSQSKFSSRIGALFTAKKPLGPTPSYLQSAKAAVAYTPLNICLLFIPVSWALHYTHQSPTITFVFSCLGIIPLAALLGFGTEQIALRTSSSVGGLLNATLGNVVEMIIAGIALKKCELGLVQSSLLGGLLSNLLLVLGMAFLVGGYRFKQTEFQPMVAQLNSSLMVVSVISLIVPAAFHEYLGDRLPQGEEMTILLQLSRGSAIILIIIYIAYLVFQFYSHNHLFVDVVQTSSMSSKSSRSSLSREDTLPPPATTPSLSTTDSEHNHVKMNTSSALFLLFATTALAYVTAENLVDSLEGLVESHPEVSKEWLTLIVIPVISNAAEHMTAVVVASKGKFDLAMSVAVGSCIQIALLVIPVLILVAWGMDKPLTLLFDEVETLVLFFSVLLVKFAIEDGKSHWMSGVVLIAVYTLIALCFWNFPEPVRMLQGQPLVCH
ncbi:calcium ion transporter [Moniliophthora roreri MCA 2997]|uniref:Vacuolar calcium ion transporter n=1 Tax=Moniliophthora roreri (strain MCA 2997) TaxID=1381753 RepID=V2XZB8_MONRO|nr:calcium ion transporter [Moniliophthora roreri MCA 2997]